mgnify:CR=1 FL=1
MLRNMNYIIMLFNIFIVPFCGFFIYIKNCKKIFPVFEIFGFYSLFCTLNLIAVRLPVYFLRLFGIQVFLWSVFYTAISFCCVLVISGLFIIFTDYIHVNFLIRKKDEE